MASKLCSFLAELKRRKVGRVSAVYVAVGLGILGAADASLPDAVWESLKIPVVAIILLGFPIALVLAWAYEIRPEARGELPTTGPWEGSGPESLSETRRGMTTEERRPAIAVLPFDDFSPNPEDAYFAHGMHDEILTQLQKIEGLAVRGRTSVLRYREDPKSLPEIAHELGVGFILEGSARKAGDQVRLTAQLIDAGRDEHLWAENYDRPLTVENLFGVQGDIAQQVARAVGVILSPEERQRIERNPTRDLKAYDYFLLGRHHLHRWSLENIEEALGFLKESVEVDPSFAQGHAGVAYAYAVLGAFGQPPQNIWPRAREAAERAMTMDETLAEAHNALALEAMSHRYDWVESEARFKKALEHNPDSVEALDWLGVSLAAIWGRFEEAMAYTRRAAAMDPLSLTVQYHLGLPRIWAGEYEEAQRAFEAIEEIGSGVFLRTHGLVYLRMAQDQFGEALELMEGLVGKANERLVIYTGLLGYLYGRTGDTQGARRQLRHLDDLGTRGIYVDPVTRAQILTSVGETKEALSLLERAYHEGIHWMIYLGNVPWDFEELHGEPRFQALLRKMDFPRLKAETNR